MRKHNLLTYKSFRESLDAWALEELVGHYVNYRKLLSLEFSTKDDEFQLYAIATRFPAKLMKPELWVIEEAQWAWERVLKD